MTKRLRIDGERLLRRIAEFATIGGTAAGGVNRQAFSMEDREARGKIAGLALSRGLKVTQDQAANLFIAFPGRELEKPVLIGSHLDSQPSGGRFDGALGSLAAFEVIETIADAGLEYSLPIELVIWSNEEGSRYAPGTMGSRAFAEGRLPKDIETLKDGEGKPLSSEIAATLAALPAVPVIGLGKPIAAYLELHIEQGPILEAENVEIGAVSSIQGTRWFNVRVEGETGHAGTTPLASRHDALATLIQSLAELQSTIMPHDADARFTVGRIAVEPGSVNAIPSVATATIDIRHPSTKQLDTIEELLQSTIDKCGRSSGCTAHLERIFDMPPAEFDSGIVSCIEEASIELGLSVKRMVSGAFHDALSVQPLAPSAMIFVPCRNGISHNEKEFVEPMNCVAGAATLLQSTLNAIAKIARPHDIEMQNGNQEKMGTAS